MSAAGVAALWRLHGLGAEVRFDPKGGLRWRMGRGTVPHAEAEARALIASEKGAILAALRAACPFPLACGGLGPCERRLRGWPCLVDGGRADRREGAA